MVERRQVPERRRARPARASPVVWCSRSTARPSRATRRTTSSQTSDVVAIGFLPKGEKIERAAERRERARATTARQPRRDQPEGLYAHRRRTTQAVADTGPRPTTTRAVDDRHHHAVKAVVLVGGEGTRLRPLTFDTPKPLLPDREPAVPRAPAHLDGAARHRRSRALARLPARRVRASTSPTATFGDVRLRYAVEPEPLGTAGAIRFAAEVAGIDERFVVCNGDVLTTSTSLRSWRSTTSVARQATIHLMRVADPSAFGVVPTFPDGEVQAFVEKPPPGQAPTDWINAGHLRARAVGAGAHPADASTSRSSGRPFRGCSMSAGSCTPWRATSTGSTSARPRSTAQRTPT